MKSCLREVSATAAFLFCVVWGAVATASLAAAIAGVAGFLGGLFIGGCAGIWVGFKVMKVVFFSRDDE
jgi:hypothetical protein